MKKIIVLLVIVVALSLSLFCCMGNSEPAAGTTDPSVTTEATSGDHQQDHGGETTETSEATDATEATTAATENTTEAATEPTEATTAPTTEPTAPADPGDIGNGGVEDTPGQTEAPTEPQPTEHKHDYKSKTVAPTCESKGYTAYTCACGDSYQDNEKSATGHNYSTKTVAPTTSEEGYDLHTCSACGHSYKDNYVPKTEPQPTEHQHNYKATTVAPGCVKIGYTQYECSCGKAYRDDTTEPIGHKYSIKETIAPTETTDGYDLHTCERCGDTYKDNWVPMTGVDNSDHTGQVWADCDNDGHMEWWDWDCNSKGHRWKNEIIQEATCCQPKIIDTRCQVVGCNAQEEGYPRESWTVPHTGDASLVTYTPVDSYAVRRRDGQAWTFSTEAEARAKAKEVADAYRNGESIHWVERIQSSGYHTVYPETFTCKTCGQTINYQEMKKDYRAGFTGTFPENPYEDRMWVEFYTKDNQP